ncbi:hypothetical protein BZD31_22645 [Salmonella enterica]|nr:hypothetical protein [Salmonella enterica]ELJ4794397.1 hypothetical protein [Salmonella enterica]
MKVAAEKLRDGCQSLTRELTRLEQLNRPLSLDEFYSWTERENFVSTIFDKYRSYIIALDVLDPKSERCDDNLLSYIENALGRHSNVITSGTYGVVDNAYLLAINVLFAISREADEM